MQLVDEADDLALGVGDLLEDSLESLLELTAVLRAGDHRADVERDEALVAQTLGDVALHDAARQPLDDRGLADARLADEHRVVLRAPRQHLDHAADLVVTTDDRVELPLAGLLGEVAPVLLERLVLLLGVLARDAMRSAHGLQRVEHGLARHTERPQEVADATRHGGHREQQVLGRQVVVVQAAALLVRRLEHAVRVGRQRGLLLRAVHLRELRERLVDAVAQRLRRDAHALEHGQHDTLGLAEEAGEQVLGRDLRVVAVAREGLRGTDGLAGLAGEAVGVQGHGSGHLGVGCHQS